MTNTWINTIGLDPTTLVDQIVNKGLGKVDAVKLVNNLIAVQLGQTPRRFSYSPPLPTGSDAARPAFARIFEHLPWIDGESVVQAGESADDRGFNWRFDTIGKDLDDLHGDAQKLFDGLEALRAGIVDALQDIAAELNRINTDLAALAPQTARETPFKWDITASPQFMGVRDLDGAKVSMWQHQDRVLVLPSVDTVGVQTTLQQRLNSGAMILGLASTSTSFADAVAAGSSATQLIAAHGAELLPDGRPVAQVLAVLPEQEVFPDVATLVDRVNSQEEAFIKSSVGSLAAIHTVTGVTSSGVPISGVSAGFLADSVVSAPAGLGSAIVAAQLGSVEDVASLSPTEMVEKLKLAGVVVTEAQVGQILTKAKLASVLGRRIG